MGEYTNDIGLHVETDVCKLISDPHNIAAPVIKVIGLDRNNCPPEPVRKQLNLTKCKINDELYQSLIPMIIYHYLLLYI